MTSTTRVTDASEAARDFRAALDQRRDAEDIMSVALAARQQAATYAGKIVCQSEELASEIEAEARAEARAATAAAQARADEILAEARESAAQIAAEAEATVADAQRHEAEARAAADSVRAQAEADLAQTRLETEQLREAARVEVAAQRSMARAAVNDQARQTLHRLESLTQQVQSALDRARSDFGGTVAHLAEFEVPTASMSALTTDTDSESDDLLSPHETTEDRRRKPFRAVR